MKQDVGAAMGRYLQRLVKEKRTRLGGLCVCESDYTRRRRFERTCTKARVFLSEEWVGRQVVRRTSTLCTFIRSGLLTIDMDHFCN